MKFNQDAFGSRLKMLRKELKMTQEQLAVKNIIVQYCSWKK